jgi:hypothetical protein
MEKKDHRRKSKRYNVSWEASVVFDKDDGTLLLMSAQTQDISSGGASILSEYANLKGSVVTLVLAQPPMRHGGEPRTFKVKSKIVSATQRSSPPTYRYGANFLRAPKDGLDFLEELMAAVAAASPREEADAPSAPAAVPAAADSTGRLALLKQLAKAKLTEEKKPDPKEGLNARVSDALQRASKYLRELAEQLNIVQPAFAKGYTIVGIPEFSGLAWESGRVDVRMSPGSSNAKLCEQVMLNFRLSGKKQIRATRESPANDRLKQLLTDYKIEFKARDERNERGTFGRTQFEFPCDVTASVVLIGDFDAGTILLKTRNVERFGLLEHRIAPEAISEESLEEFTGFLLGETSRIGPKLLKRP